MIAQLCCHLGWTWDYCEQHMTMPRLEHLLTVWRDAPPVNVTLARFVGIKPEPRRRREPTFDEVAAELSAFGFRAG